jgi:hypothetical protein
MKFIILFSCSDHPASIGSVIASQLYSASLSYIYMLATYSIYYTTVCTVCTVQQTLASSVTPQTGSQHF